jgi:hypothetical protein
MSTLIMTARLNDIDPLAWLADVLARIADIPQSRLFDCCPGSGSRRAGRRPPDQHRARRSMTPAPAALTQAYSLCTDVATGTECSRFKLGRAELGHRVDVDRVGPQQRERPPEVGDRRGDLQLDREALTTSVTAIVVLPTTQNPADNRMVVSSRYDGASWWRMPRNAGNAHFDLKIGRVPNFFPHLWDVQPAGNLGCMPLQTRPP